MSIQASGLSSGPPGSGVVVPLKDTLKDKIQNINGVDSVFNRDITTLVVEFNNKQGITYAGSVPIGKDRNSFVKMSNLKMSSGRFLKDNEPKSVVVGNDFSNEVKKGYGVTTFGRGVNVGDSLVVNDKEYKVVGILAKKGSFIIDNMLFFNEDVTDIFPDDGTTDIIAVKVKDAKQISSVKASVERLLRKERNVKAGAEDFTVSTPEQALRSLNSALFAVQLFVYIIAGISLAVGGIGIMNTMYTSVLERTKQIGIMKAIGARNSVIFILFFIESGFLGLVGGILGVIFGASLAYGLAFLGSVFLGSDLIRAEISLFLIVGSLVFSFVLGTFFGVLPAYRASRLAPVEALRK
jgi:putative ABC transport system permease protein